MSNEFKDRIRQEATKEKYDDDYRNRENEVLRIFEKKAEEQRLNEENRKLEENIKYFEDVLKQEETRRTSQENQKNKRNLKNSSSKIKNKTYKGKINNRIKALIATTLLVGGIVGGTYGIDKHHEYIYDYAATATRVEEMTDDELKDYIENILKEEISKATGVDTDEIDISKYTLGTSSVLTKVTAGENEYKYDEDLRSPFFDTGNLKSKGLRSVINMTRSANGNRKELIQALMQAEKFSEEKDLVVNDDKLKEVDSDKTYDNER